MKLAKASPEEVDCLLNLARVLNSADDDGFPCKPDGTWNESEDSEWFDKENPEHLRKFYDRVMACFDKHPGGINRTVWGYKLAMDNDVFDPDKNHYDWHPSLTAAIEDREQAKQDAIGALTTTYARTCAALENHRAIHFPRRSFVNVEGVGVGVVVAMDGCPPDKIPVLVESGNVWFYAMNLCTPSSAKNAGYSLRKIWLARNGYKPLPLSRSRFRKQPATSTTPQS